MLAIEEWGQSEEEVGAHCLVMSCFGRQCGRLPRGGREGEGEGRPTLLQGRPFPSWAFHTSQHTTFN